MDIQANQTTDSLLTASPKRKPFYRYGFITLLFGCIFLGVFTQLVMTTQARSRAQAEQDHARGAMWDSEHRSERSKVPSRIADSASVPTPAILPYPHGQTIAPPASTPAESPNYGLASGRMQSVTRMVPQLRNYIVADPVTGNNTLTQHTVFVPVTSMEPNNAMAPTSDPSMDYQSLEAEIQRLSERIRAADIKQRDSLNEALTRKLTELFDARHKAQTSRVEAIRAEVQQTQELLDKRLKLKSQIIDRRLKELTGQRDELSWNPSVANALPSALPSGVLRREEALSMGEPMEPSGLPGSAMYPDSPGLMPKQNLPQPMEQSLPMPQQGFHPTSGPIPNSIDFAAPSEMYPPNLPNLSLPPNSQPSIFIPQNNNAIPTTGEPANNSPAVTGTSTDPQRSFMSIGFKLKRLVKDLAELNTSDSDSTPSKAAINLQNAIDETRSVWDYEKTSLQLDLETTESEFGIVKNQLERTTEIVIAEKARIAAGVSPNDLAKTELSKLEIERQLLQIRSRLASIKKSLDWMAKFEESVAVNHRNNNG